MKKRIIAIIALAASLCACTKENAFEEINKIEESASPLIFRATIEGATSSKATLDNTAKRASWEIGDQININGILYSAETAGASTSFIKTTITQEIRPAYVSSTDAGSYENQPAKNLVDDSGVGTRWIANKSHQAGGVWNIVVTTGIATQLKTIKLWNADNESYPGRRWKSINVYASTSANGPWGNPIKTLQNLNLAKNKQGLAGEITINATGKYTHYRIDVLENEGDKNGYMQMSDMKFVVIPAIIPPYNAYFPASLYNGTTASLPATITETWSENKFNMPMCARGESTELQFKNLCGVLKIKVNKDRINEVKSIRVSSANKAVSGAFTVNNDNTAVLVKPDRTDNNVTVTYTEAVPTTAEGTVFYVAIPAQTYRGLKIELSSDGEHFNKSITTKENEDIVVERNKIYPINHVYTIPADALPGEFTVDEGGRKVRFSKGNLKANFISFEVEDLKNLFDIFNWGFAEHQYDYIGNASGNAHIDQIYDNTNYVVDLFGWSLASGNVWGISASKDEGVNIIGNFYDWGKIYSVIKGLASDTWRTLSQGEWTYILYTRTMQNNKPRYSLNITYVGRMGVVLYPDDYAGSTLNSDTNYFMLPEGVVFLPAAGWREGTTISDVGSIGNYWSSNEYNQLLARPLCFSCESITTENYDKYFNGFSVRLVTDSK